MAQCLHSSPIPIFKMYICNVKAHNRLPQHRRQKKAKLFNFGKAPDRVVAFEPTRAPPNRLFSYSSSRGLSREYTQSDNSPAAKQVIGSSLPSQKPSFWRSTGRILRSKPGSEAHINTNQQHNVQATFLLLLPQNQERKESPSPPTYDRFNSISRLAFLSLIA